MPYILDDRHIDDTLFLVFEEDTQLFRGKGEPIASKPRLTKSQEWFQEELPGGMSSHEMKKDRVEDVKTLQAHWSVRQNVPGDHKRVIRSTGQASDEASFNYRAKKAQKKRSQNSRLTWKRWCD